VRAFCRPLRSMGGWDRERAALGRMSGLWGTTRTLRSGLRSARRVTLLRRQTRPRLPFGANLLFFHANARVRRGGARAIGGPKHNFGLNKQDSCLILLWISSRPHSGRPLLNNGTPPRRCEGQFPGPHERRHFPDAHRDSDPLVARQWRVLDLKELVVRQVGQRNADRLLLLLRLTHRRAPGQRQISPRI
jgi:hypothetical protein